MVVVRIVFAFLLFTLVSPVFAASYKDPRGHFTFDIPTGWTAAAVGDNDASVSDGAASYARIINVPGGGKDQQVVARVLEQISGQWQSFKQDSRGDATLAGHEGIFIVYSGVNPKGVQAVLRVVAAPFGEDAYMLLMSAPATGFTRAKAAFKQIETSFALASGKSAQEPARTDALPDHAAPKGLQSLDETSGGRILHGSLSDAASSPAAFKAGLQRLRGYFDTAPKILSAVQSKDGAITMVMFSAALRSAPVSGLAVATYDPAGNSRFAALFDDPKRLPKSLQPMLRHLNEVTQTALENMRPAGGKGTPDFARFEAESKHVALNRVAFPDGTATVGVAAGFTPQEMNVGSFLATSADGAYMKLFMPFRMLDPRGSIYQLQKRLANNSGGSPQIPGQVVVEYDTNPVSAWKKYLTENARAQNVPDPSPQILRSDPLQGTSAGWTGRLVSGTMTLHGDPFVFTGTMLASPPPSREGGWMVQVTILVAPENRAAADMPKMIAMQNSEQIDMEKVRDQTMRNIQKINEEGARWLAANKAAGDAARNARFEQSMNNARATREVMDQSVVNFIHYINDTTVVRNQEGGQATVNSNFAAALTNANPKKFQVVPVGQYAGQ